MRGNMYGKHTVVSRRSLLWEETCTVIGLLCQHDRLSPTMVQLENIFNEVIRNALALRSNIFARQ